MWHLLETRSILREIFPVTFQVMTVVWNFQKFHQLKWIYSYTYAYYIDTLQTDLESKEKLYGLALFFTRKRAKLKG